MAPDKTLHTLKKDSLPKHNQLQPTSVHRICQFPNNKSNVLNSDVIHPRQLPSMHFALFILHSSKASSVPAQAAHHRGGFHPVCCCWRCSSPALWGLLGQEGQVLLARMDNITLFKTLLWLFGN